MAVCGCSADLTDFDRCGESELFLLKCSASSQFWGKVVIAVFSAAAVVVVVVAAVIVAVVGIGQV